MGGGWFFIDLLDFLALDWLLERQAIDEVNDCGKGCHVEVLEAQFYRLTILTGVLNSLHLSHESNQFGSIMSGKLSRLAYEHHLHIIGDFITVLLLSLGFNWLGETASQRGSFALQGRRQVLSALRNLDMGLIGSRHELVDFSLA